MQKPGIRTGVGDRDREEKLVPRTEVGARGSFAEIRAPEVVE